jgi:hypothetical protein
MQMPLFDLTEFFKLSSALNYNLSAASLNRYNVLMYIIGDKRLDADEKIDREQKGILMEALGYLFSVYSQKRRRLGPMAVLHPLRTAALFRKSLVNPNLVDLLTLLFHDILEDIKPVDYPLQQWKSMENQLSRLMERMEKDDESRLVTRLTSLTRLENESYYQYIGRLLDNTQNYPEIVQIKLADRLDNTLDMRIDLRDPLTKIDFFETVFQIMFVNNYPGYIPKMEHSPTTAINGARRLYQLFKNAVLLSLIRQYVPASDRGELKILFDALSDAGLKEAQRTLIHLIGYHVKDLHTQRDLVLQAMQYCYSHCHIFKLFKRRRFLYSRNQCSGYRATIAIEWSLILLDLRVMQYFIPGKLGHPHCRQVVGDLTVFDLQLMVDFFIQNGVTTAIGTG